MHFPLKWFRNANFRTVFDNNGAAGGDDGGNGAAGGGSGGDGPGSDRTYTKAELEAAIAAERTRSEQTHRKTVAELQQLKNQTQLSAEEKTALQSRIEALEKEYMSKEELAAREAKQREAQQQETLTKLQQENASWKQRYEHHLVRSALVDAAAKQGALNPDVVFRLMQSDSVVENVANADGKPTDNFRVRIKYNQKTDAGIKELVLDPIDAMKLVAEDKNYSYMFAGGKAGGVGGQQSAVDEPIDFSKITPEQYRKARDKLLG